MTFFLFLLRSDFYCLVRYCHFGVSPVNYSDSDSDSLFAILSASFRCIFFMSHFFEFEGDYINIFSV